MVVDICKDGKTVYSRIEVEMTDLHLSESRHWEGNFTIAGGDGFDVRGRYRLELDDGKSADIVLTHVIKREPVFVHFRVLQWKDKPQGSGITPALE